MKGLFFRLPLVEIIALEAGASVASNCIASPNASGPGSDVHAAAHTATAIISRILCVILNFIYDNMQQSVCSSFYYDIIGNIRFASTGEIVYYHRPCLLVLGHADQYR